MDEILDKYFKQLLILESIIIIVVYFLFILASIYVMDNKEHIYWQVISTLGIYGAGFGIVFTAINCKEGMII